MDGHNIGNYEFFIRMLIAVLFKNIRWDKAMKYVLGFANSSWIKNFEAIFVNQQYRVADKVCLDSARRYMSSHYFSEYWSSKLRSKIDWR